MSELIERDTYLEFHDQDGNVERHFPFTKFKNIEDIPLPDENTAAPVKIYPDTGENEDGALSQKSVTEKLTKVQAALQLLAANSFVLDDITGQTYKIGSSDGELYFVESDVSLQEIIDMIVTATEVLGSQEDDDGLEE